MKNNNFANTEYSLIYDEFKDKITDYNLPLYEDKIQDKILFSLLRKACGRFKRICKNPLDFNDMNILMEQFECELTQEEIDIITTWMVYFWITPFVNNSDNLQNILNTKDFTQFSPSNLTQTLKEIQKESLKEARSLQNEYSIINGDMVKSRKV